MKYPIAFKLVEPTVFAKKKNFQGPLTTVALEVLLVMYKNTEILCKNGYTVDS